MYEAEIRLPPANTFTPTTIMRLSSASKSNQMRIEPTHTEPANFIARVEEDMSLFKTVPPNVVQSIRAFRAVDLQEEAARLGQHFLYAYCADATTKQQVLNLIAGAFHFPRHLGKSFDTLEDGLTHLACKAGPQPGFLIVIEQLPNTPKFDKEARETLLDVFRDAADFWAEKKVAFRVFYSCQ
jgi:Barstar (barnase inhibitor)